MQLEDAIPRASAKPAAYVLAPLDRRFLYKGSSRDLRGRLQDHQAGRAGRTKNHRPLDLLFFRYYETYREAHAMEQWLKSGVGRKWLREKFPPL